MNFRGEAWLGAARLGGARTPTGRYIPDNLTRNQNDMTTQITIKEAIAHPSVHKRILDVLGKERASEFSAAVVQVAQQSNALAKCDPYTVIGAAMTAATLHLPVQPQLGFAHIVPYGKRGQFQLGYKGLIQLAQRSGQYASITDAVIPSGVLVKWDSATEELELDWENENPAGEHPDGYLCRFKLLNGFSKTVFWHYSKVEAHAKRFSQAYSKGYDTPWKSDFDSMALKTVIKHTLGKYGPLSVEMEKAITQDQAVIDIEGAQTFPDNPDNDPGPDPFTGEEKEAENE